MKKDSDSNYENNKSNILLEKEYEIYRSSLIVKKECAACHYLQGLLFTGASLFFFTRMRFIWDTLNYKLITGYSILCITTSLIGLYKFSYAYHIYTVQSNIKNLTKQEKF